MRAAFERDPHTPHGILNRIEQMGYTIVPAERAAREGPDDAECPTCDGSFRHEWPCPALLRCAVEGCDREATCGFPSPGGYLRVCGAHFDPEAARD